MQSGRQDDEGEAIAEDARMASIRAKVVVDL